MIGPQPSGTIGFNASIASALIIELARHRAQDGARPSGQSGARHEAAMCGVTPEAPCFVVHTTRTGAEPLCSGRITIKQGSNRATTGSGLQDSRFSAVLFGFRLLDEIYRDLRP